MDRLRRALGALCVAVTGVIAGGAAPDPYLMEFGVRGERTIFERVCRSTVTSLPPAMALADFIIAEGGRSCFAGGVGVLFVPVRDSGCAQPEIPGFSQPVEVSHRQAQTEMLQCQAAYLPSADEPTGVLILSPTPTSIDFIQFGLDMAALVVFDMLPVTHFGVANGVVCMEATSPEAVAERVTSADIATPDEFNVEITHGSCRELTYIRTGQTWPEVVVGSD